MPQEPDAFSGLRQAWSDTLRLTGLLPQILQRLGSSDKAAPLSEAELQPFLSALRHWLGVPSEAVWNTCLEVTPGQPFRWLKFPEILTLASLISWCLESHLEFTANFGRAQLWPLASHLTLIPGLWSVAHLRGSQL